MLTSTGDIVKPYHQDGAAVAPWERAEKLRGCGTCPARSSWRKTGIDTGAQGGQDGEAPVSTPARRRVKACLIRRETCIWETPIRSPISAWVRS